MKTKMKSNYLEKRMDLVKKKGEDKNYKPTPEELEEAYGYLDYCFDCGKPIRWGESFSHGFFGNSHKFGCSLQERILGRLWFSFWLIFKLIIFIPALIIFGIYLLVKLIFREKTKK